MVICARRNEVLFSLLALLHVDGVTAEDSGARVGLFKEATKICMGSINRHSRNERKLYILYTEPSRRCNCNGFSNATVINISISISPVASYVVTLQGLMF